MQIIFIIFFFLHFIILVFCEQTEIVPIDQISFIFQRNVCFIKRKKNFIAYCNENIISINCFLHFAFFQYDGKSYYVI